MNKSKWVDTETYLYGRIASIKESTVTLDDNGRYYEITANENSLKSLLNADRDKLIGINVLAKQNVYNGELKELHIKGFVDYYPVYDKTELDCLIEQGTEVWKNVDNVDEWLQEVRDGA
jgi:hypothetical protein